MMCRNVRGVLSTVPIRQEPISSSPLSLTIIMTIYLWSLSRFFRGLIILLAFLWWGWIYAAIELPMPIDNTIQYLQSTVITTDGIAWSSPLIELRATVTNPLTITTSDQNAIWIHPWALRDWSIMRDDLWFPIIETPVDCDPGFVYAVDKNGKGSCRLVSQLDVDMIFSQTRQKRLLWPCPDHHFLTMIQEDGTAVCRSITKPQLISILSQTFIQKIKNTCWPWMFAQGINLDGSVTCASVLSFLTTKPSCQRWFALGWFLASGDLLCRPLAETKTCPSGQAIIGFDAQGNSICGQWSIHECWPNQVVVWWVNGTPAWCASFDQLIQSCPANHWISSISPLGMVTCTAFAGECPAWQFVVALTWNIFSCSSIEWDQSQTCQPSWWACSTTCGWWTQSDWCGNTRACNSQPCSCIPQWWACTGTGIQMDGCGNTQTCTIQPSDPTPTPTPTPTPDPTPTPTPTPTPDPTPTPTPTPTPPEPEPEMCDCVDPFNWATIRYPCDTTWPSNCI